MKLIQRALWFAIIVGAPLFAACNGHDGDLVHRFLSAF
jgi:hypothetical protein